MLYGNFMVIFCQKDKHITTNFKSMVASNIIILASCVTQLKLFKMAQKMQTYDEKRLLKKSPLSRPRYKIQTLSAAVQKVVLMQPSFPDFHYWLRWQSTAQCPRCLHIYIEATLMLTANMVISVKYLQLGMVLWYFCASGSCHVFGLLESMNEFIIWKLNLSVQY